MQYNSIQYSKHGLDSLIEGLIPSAFQVTKKTTQSMNMKRRGNSQIDQLNPCIGRFLPDKRKGFIR